MPQSSYTSYNQENKMLKEHEKVEQVAQAVGRYGLDKSSTQRVRTVMMTVLKLDPEQLAFLAKKYRLDQYIESSKHRAGRPTPDLASLENITPAIEALLMLRQALL